MGHGSDIDHITSLSNRVFLEEIGCGAAECDGIYPNQHIDGLVQERRNSSAYVFLAVAHRFTLGTDSRIQGLCYGANMAKIHFE